ncbi:MAG: hypothetical protein GC189_03580 [Alphaproteobacteria bacterium]|nr:hypothetical protein [Alphaproteobacteria bacterium]
MADEVIIVGSGPSGVSAAHAALARGWRVRMLDVGETLEHEREARRARMAATEPDAWTQQDRTAARAPAHGEGMRPYGSDFALRDAIGFFGEAGAPNGVGLRPSFAAGGLSNGWGSAVTPYRFEDIADWPSVAQELDPHYQAVARFMPIAAKLDDLADVFPLWRPHADTSLPSSAQGARLLAKLQNKRDALAAQGVRFGKARQAVAPGCRLCALCLHGCPYQLIFSARHALSELQRSERFAYEPGLIVERFEETGERVRVHARTKESNGKVVRDGARLFLAAGVLPTALITLQSLNAAATLALRDSQHALMPMLHAWSPGADPAREPRHALTQAFLEIEDALVSPFTIHAQLYTYNDFFPADLAQRFGALAGLLDPVIQATAKRLIVAQTFLHSRHSASMKLSMRDGRLAIAAEPNPETQTILKAALGKVARAVAHAGVTALPMLARPGAPGSSFHCGGSLPMRDAPRDLETDPFGRPNGLQRVHIVDASVLPSIPATTITFSVMANAHRIASTAPA